MRSAGTDRGRAEASPDTAARRWLRRALTFPGYLFLSSVVLAGLPVWLVLAAVLDLASRRPGVAVRGVLLLALYLVCEVAGVLAASFLWLAYAVVPRTSRARFLGWNFALQQWWAHALFAGAARLFGLDVQLEGVDEAVREGGPLIVFIRHASLADTVLPAVYLSRTRGLRLRYVMKRELLWDPCLDVVGQRLPNVFVRRESDTPDREIASVHALAAGLGPEDGVLIYPEGTRFSEARRERILRRMAEANDPRLERARRLRHVLPPKLGGPLALLDSCPSADVAFFAHTGFEGIRGFRALARGALIGREIRIGVWRVPRGQVPKSNSERVDWLDAQWRRVDEWIEERSG